MLTHFVPPPDRRVTAVTVAAALKSNRRLRELDLGENGIRAAGASALGEALTRNRTLTDLGLRHNGLCEGAAALAKGLVANRGLRALDLRDNDLGEREVLALARALRSNTTLLALEVGLDARMLAQAADEVVAIRSALVRNREERAATDASAAGASRRSQSGVATPEGVAAQYAELHQHDLIQP